MYLFCQKNNIINEFREKCKKHESEIKSRDDALETMEHILEKSTSRYALLVGKEQSRLETNRDIELQITPITSDSSTQVNFVLSTSCKGLESLVVNTN